MSESEAPEPWEQFESELEEAEKSLKGVVALADTPPGRADDRLQEIKQELLSRRDEIRQALEDAKKAGADEWSDHKKALGKELKVLRNHLKRVDIVS